MSGSDAGVGTRNSASNDRSMGRVAEGAEIDEKVAAAVDDCTGKKVEVERRREGGRVGGAKVHV